MGVEDEVSWTKDETSQLEDVVREKTAQIAALVSGLEALQVGETVSLLSFITFRVQKTIQRTKLSVNRGLGEECG